MQNALIFIFVHFKPQQVYSAFILGFTKKFETAGVDMVLEAAILKSQKLIQGRQKILAIQHKFMWWRQ
jgi:hypothetical protein